LYLHLKNISLLLYMTLKREGQLLHSLLRVTSPFLCCNAPANTPLP
jgi:hypothetical protein